MPQAVSLPGAARSAARKPAAGQDAARLLSGLVALLHDGAPAEAFAACLDEAKALPHEGAAASALVEAVHMAMAVRNRLELQHERERGLLAVIESAQDLSSHLDLTGLLSAIVARARNLLGSDLGWLSVHDAQRGEFHVVVADGALAQATGGMVTRTDLGVASIVMATRLPFATGDYLHDNRFVHDARLDDAFRAEGIAALVGVPLVWEGEVIGLLFVADRYHRSHTAQSISILCTLATHAAVALKNAREFERANAALAKAAQARDELERHLRNIQAAADAHEQMTSLLARGASLDALCQAVAQQLGGAVLVLDEAAQVASRGRADGYADGGAQTYAPHGTHSAAIAAAFRQSRQTGRSAQAYEDGGESCRVMPVIGGDGVLGSLLLFSRGALEEVAVRTFERSSSVIGIVLLSQERMEAARSRSSATLLRSLLSPRPHEASLLAQRAGQHGLDLSQPVSLLLVDPAAPGPSHAARRLRALPDLAGALVDDVDGTVVVLCASTRAPEVRQAVAACLRRESGAAHRGVISRPGDAAELPALHATLSRALPVLERLGVQGDIVGQNELALYSALFETHDRTSLASFLEATIGPLLAQDRKRGTELAATLLTYFETHQNARATAQRLDIHVNTVRQRLATIEELLGHWGQASRALEIHIALRLWSLGSPPAAA